MSRTLILLVCFSTASCTLSAADVATRRRAASQDSARSFEEARQRIFKRDRLRAADKSLQAKGLVLAEARVVAQAPEHGLEGAERIVAYADGSNAAGVAYADGSNAAGFAFIADRCRGCGCSDSVVYRHAVDQDGADVIVRLTAEVSYSRVKQRGVCGAAGCGTELPPQPPNVIVIDSLAVSFRDATFTQHVVQAECESYSPVP